MSAQTQQSLKYPKIISKMFSCHIQCMVKAFCIVSTTAKMVKNRMLPIVFPAVSFKASAYKQDHEDASQYTIQWLT